MSKGAAALGRLILDGSLLPAVQGSAGSPLAFPIQGIAHGLPAGGTAVAAWLRIEVAGCLVAARPIAQWPGKKSPSCVTTRRCKLWFFNGLRPGLHSLAARLFGLGVLDFDVEVLATFGLASGTAPAVQLALAIRMLTVALVVTTRPVFASAPVAQTRPRTRAAPAARTRLAAVSSRTLASAHGRLDLPRESSGRVCNHSPRARIKTRTKKMLAILIGSDEPDKERNKVRDAPQNETPGSMTNPVAHSR